MSIGCYQEAGAVPLLGTVKTYPGGRNNGARLMKTTPGTEAAVTHIKKRQERKHQSVVGFAYQW